MYHKISMGTKQNLVSKNYGYCLFSGLQRPLQWSAAPVAGKSSGLYRVYLYGRQWLTSENIQFIPVLRRFGYLLYCTMLNYDDLATSIQMCNAGEHSAIDRIIDSKELLLAGSIDKKTVLGIVLQYLCVWVWQIISMVVAGCCGSSMELCLYT